MKHFSLLLIYLFPFGFNVKGQINLVPNHSFEFNNGCPGVGANTPDITTATPWQDPPSLSSDYYNVCGANGFSIPQTQGGYINAQDSFAFAGIDTYAFAPPFIYDYREYLQVPLIDTLEAGKKYCVTFYIILADSSEYAIGNISAYFSPNGGGSSQAAYFTHIPQVNNPTSNVLSNKAAWTEISGSFTAVGNERYLTIGNFQNDSNTNWVFTGNSSGNSGYWVEAYYFVDNVSVVEVAPCSAGQPKTICATDSVELGSSPLSDVTYSWQPSIGLSDSSIANPNASPTTTTTYTLTQMQCDVVSTATVTVTVRNDCNTPPSLIIPTTLKTNQMFEIIGLEPNSKLEIFDAIGRRVYYSESYQNDFGGYNISIGMYVVRLTSPNGQTVKQKLCVIK